MLGVFDRARPATPRLCGVAGVAFRRSEGLGTWFIGTFAAQYPAYTFPCQRFGHALAGVST
jgi:hypothetical protein